MLTSLLILGFLFGLCGTVIESLGYSLEHKKLTYRGDKFFWNFPSKPIYAIGGLLLYFSIKFTKASPWYAVVLISTIIVIIWEFLCGLFCTHILKERFWDYSRRNLNLQGHICLWSAKWWLIFSSIFYFFIYDHLVNLESYLDRTIKISNQEDLLIFFLVILFVASLAILKKKH